MNRPARKASIHGKVMSSAMAKYFEESSDSLPDPTPKPDLSLDPILCPVVTKYKLRLRPIKSGKQGGNSTLGGKLTANRGTAEKHNPASDGRDQRTAQPKRNDEIGIAIEKKVGVKMRTYGLRKKPVKRIYIRCHEPGCGKMNHSTKEATDHHRQIHQKRELCNKCGNWFASPESLRRHNYMHKRPRYECKDCPTSFYYKAELDKHRYRHRHYAAFKCHSVGCDKKYRWKCDLENHVQSAHKRNPVVLKCPFKGCNYTGETKKKI